MAALVEYVATINWTAGERVTFQVRLMLEKPVMIFIKFLVNLLGLVSAEDLAYVD